MLTDYNYDIQKLFLELFIADPESFVRVQNIFNPTNFDSKLRHVAVFLSDYVKKYNSLPDVYVINTTNNINLTKIDDVYDDHISWLMEEFEGFTRRKELERAILKSADLLEKGEYGPVEKLIKDAVQISLHKDLGTDYFDDPKQRLLKIKDNNGQTSTGWKSLDSALYGGYNRGELQLFLGGSGSGKSVFLQNLAVNFIEKGLNGIYLSLELSEELCSMRIDSMVSGIPAKDIFKRLDDVDMRIKMASKGKGRLMVKYMPAQSNINDIRSYVKELYIKEKFKTDFICIDYLDLLTPASVKVPASDVFTKDKYVAEEVRNYGRELGIYLFSAGQFNRSATDEVEFDHSHIAGGMSKIYTSDNVFGIFTSRAMRERGKYQLQLMKTRNSSGVGTKVELDFDTATLRIQDSDEEQVVNTSPIAERLKKNVMASSEETDEPMRITADVQTNKLNQLLNKIKSQ